MPPKKNAETKKPKATAKGATTTKKRRASPARPLTGAGTNIPYPQGNEAHPSHAYLSGNALVCGDNIDVLKELPDNCVDLIYLDPPFNSNQFYVAAFGDKGMVKQQLRDVWRWTVETENTYKRLPHGKLLDCLNGIRLQTGETSQMAAYCVFMARRLEQLHRVLKPTGSLYLHCDDNASHYLKILLDTVFGRQNFRNEVTWIRSLPHNDANRFGRNKDSIFWFAKSNKSTFNPQFRPQKEESVRAHYREGADGRFYRLASLLAPGGRGPLYEYKGFERNWRFTIENMEALEAEGRVWFEPGKVPQRILFLDESKGALVQDHWDDINPMNAMSKERIGYPTQKPLALLNRIIKASSNPGDLVLDPFCGCGTAADAAASLGRGYLGVDVSAIAVRVMEQRLASRGKATSPIVYGLDWSDDEWEQFERQALRTRDDSEDGVPGWAWAEDRVAGILNAIPNEVKQGDGGVDARYFGVTDTKTQKQLVIPIQVKMHRNASSVGRPDMDRLLGSQVAMQNRGVHAPMSLMVSLYPPPNSLRVFAAQQGHVTITTTEEGPVEYPVMQVLSVQEILQKGERPKLPPIDPRSLVGDTQTKF